MAGFAGEAPTQVLLSAFLKQLYFTMKCPLMMRAVRRDDEGSGSAATAGHDLQGGQPAEGHSGCDVVPRVAAGGDRS